jgi:hypothetical protein
MRFGWVKLANSDSRNVMFSFLEFSRLVDIFYLFYFYILGWGLIVIFCLFACSFVAVGFFFKTKSQYREDFAEFC